MNKKTKTKILTLSAVSALSLAAIWVLASNPNDLLNFEWEVKQDAHLELSGLSLTTDPTTPQATSKSDVSWTVNDGKLITHTRTNTSTNQISANGTLSFWGSNNNTSDPESLILGGSSNEITDTAKANIIAASQWVKTAGEGTTNHGTGNVILASSGVNLTGNGNILRAGNNTKIHGNDNLTFATDKVKISANNSIVIGGNITINDNGSFVFNGTPDPVTTKKPNTAIINTSNGMIINTETKTATNTDLTISGSLQVGIGSQIDKDGAIISDRCIKLKGISNGEIGLECREHTNFWGETSLPKTPKCGRNATNYAIHKSNWRGTNKSDFCSEGELDITKENKGFRTLKERTTATGTGMYAKSEFTYDFTICFWDGNPLCAPKKLSKTWRCKTPEGNAIRCEANLQIKKMECDAKTHHFEDVNQTNWSTNGDQWQCLPNIKFVDCDNSQRLDTTHGLFPNATVKVEREKSRRNYTAPQACKLKCLDGYHLADNNTRCESNTREVPCENKNHVVDTERGHITNSTYIETRDSENWRPKTKVCHLNCNEGGVLNTARTACEQKREKKVCNQTFSDWEGLIPTNTGTELTYYRDPTLRRIPDAKLCDFSCKPWYNKDATNRRCVRCDANHNRDASSESCVKKQVSCSGNQPPHSIPNTKAIAPERPNTPVELVSPGSTKACSYICEDGYVMSNQSSTCLKCKSWTWNSTDRTCVSEPVCPSGTVYGEGHSGEGCYKEGNCLNWEKIDNNLNLWYAMREVNNKPFAPLARNLQWTYVKGEPKERSCQYTCPAGYENDPRERACKKIECIWDSLSNRSVVSGIYEYTPRAYREGDARRPSKFVPQQELEGKRKNQEEGCFYTCDAAFQYTYSYGKTVCLTKKEIEQKKKEERENSCLNNKLDFGDYDSMEYYENPSKKDEHFTLVKDDVFRRLKPSNAQWCFATCKQWYNLVQRSEKSLWCVPNQCKKNEYWYETKYSYGFCHPCPTGKIWNIRGPKTPNNIPIKCVDACAGGLIRRDGVCLSPDRQEEQCVWEWLYYDRKSKLCKGCLSGETFDKETWTCK